MALIYRDGRPYLYRSLRREGRVTSQYGGSGETALLIAAWETIERDSRDLDRWLEQENRRDLDEVNQALDVMVKRGLALAREALTEAGYHQHHRGEWRRRRVPRRPEGEDR
jgi:hypothetical protein